MWRKDLRTLVENRKIDVMILTDEGCLPEWQKCTHLSVIMLLQRTRQEKGSCSRVCVLSCKRRGRQVIAQCR